MVVSIHSARVIPLSIALLLPACSAPSGEFPSLERRPFETETPVAEPAAPARPVKLSGALAAKVEAIMSKHGVANANFTKALPAMQRTAAGAAGRSPGSEAWVNAHLVLSRLDKSRADSVVALGELDGLIADQIDGDSDYVGLLVEEQEQIARDVAAQRSEIDRLSRLIGE